MLYNCVIYAGADVGAVGDFVVGAAVVGLSVGFLVGARVGFAVGEGVGTPAAARGPAVGITIANEKIIAKKTAIIMQFLKLGPLMSFIFD